MPAGLQWHHVSEYCQRMFVEPMCKQWRVQFGAQRQFLLHVSLRLHGKLLRNAHKRLFARSMQWPGSVHTDGRQFVSMVVWSFFVMSQIFLNEKKDSNFVVCVFQARVIMATLALTAPVSLICATIILALTESAVNVNQKTII